MHHVIIGAGPVATNAIETIRQFDGGQSQITLISDEPAHSRMALPYWLSGQFPREHTSTGDDAYFRRLNVDARIGARAAALDPQARTVTLGDGSTLAFDDLLIATGASPLGLRVPGADLPGVQGLWTLGQTELLLNATAGLERPRVVMVGAGFIGFIMLNAMSKRGWTLTVIEREAHVLPRMLDEAGASLVESWLADRGVAVHANATVHAIAAADGGAKRVELDGGPSIECDAVVVATGIRPNLDLARAAGIETEQGILVNDRMQTNVPHVFAGGDCAQGPVMFSDRREIHPIQPTAVDHGRVAGANMAGHEVHYPGSLSMNILDVCGLQTASFGQWSDAQADAMTISNPSGRIYRKLLWTGDRITGAIFAGRANDMGMLTDVGMVKGFMQTGTRLGPWKEFLRENPFDVRRPYVACNVARRLVDSTLLGRPSKPRDFRAGGVEPKTTIGRPANPAPLPIPNGA
ncbi:MAG TPA: FAD-dependent oxidoreductase [Planctomycetaceae bacterium]|nr:FAD-dependent oxidoreductase [Planctomycetaceae bacterium]